MSGPKAKTRRAATAHERGYIEGRRMILRRLIAQCAAELGYGDMKDPLAKIASLIADREDTRSALRSVCEFYGDNEWEDNLSLADVVEKHLGRHLDEAARTRGEPRR